MATKIYVGNLSYNTTEDQLREAFAAIGEVESAALIIDRQTNQSKGFAFIEMTDAEKAKAAISQLDGTDLDGRTIKVSEAKPREEGGSRGGGYGGGGYDAGRRSGSGGGRY